MNLLPVCLKDLIIRSCQYDQEYLLPGQDSAGNTTAVSVKIQGGIDKRNAVRLTTSVLVLEPLVLYIAGESLRKNPMRD